VPANRRGRGASHSSVRRIVLPVSVILSAACMLVLTQAGLGAAPPVPDAPIAGNTTGFLSECLQLPDARKARCYIRGLLREVERSGNPATGVPAIDGKVHDAGGFLEAACHSLMHEVGRTWAREHDLTLEDLQRYVPHSNDPGCSAGFGMGLAMYLGPELVVDPRKVLDTCTSLPTRFREYTCVHGLGHAFMRGFHGYLRDAVTACNKLGTGFSPDCAQGAFHDYWISLGGGDGTERPEQADDDPASVCGAYTYKRPCWYRYFWEREASSRVYEAADILGLCTDAEGMQRAGCVSGASLLLSRERDPVDHARVCGRLQGVDTYNCLRGVNVPALVGRTFEQLRLVRTCGDLPDATSAWCYRWFGRTLAVLTDGAFRTRGCSQLEGPSSQGQCARGGARTGLPLRTFS
jgi:hypothetical protein